MALTIVFLRFSVRRFMPKLSLKVNYLYTSNGVLVVIAKCKFAMVVPHSPPKPRQNESILTGLIVFFSLNCLKRAESIAKTVFACKANFPK